MAFRLNRLKLVSHQHTAGRRLTLNLDFLFVRVLFEEVEIQAFESHVQCYLRFALFQEGWRKLLRCLELLFLRLSFVVSFLQVKVPK